MCRRRRLCRPGGGTGLHLFFTHEGRKLTCCVWVKAELGVDPERVKEEVEESEGEQLSAPRRPRSSANER